MDIFSQLPALGGVGLGGTLVFVILYLLRANYNDRAQHKELVAALRASHKEESDDMNKKIDRLEKRLEGLELEVDMERDLRRKAQDDAADATRRMIAAETRASTMQQMIEGRPHDPPPSPSDPWSRP